MQYYLKLLDMLLPDSYIKAHTKDLEDRYLLFAVKSKSQKTRIIVGLLEPGR